MSNSTASQLRAQWTNPSDVLSLLLIIGGDIVQKALAQATVGQMPHVCFSFGWVAYSFTTLVGVVGDGRLLPPPDYPVKVFNLKTGYMRENKNWVVGRLLRDNEVFMNRKRGLHGAGIRISIFMAEAPAKTMPFVYRTERLWFGISLLQVIISAVPLIYDREWGVLLITVSGMIAAIIAGMLPQWSVEKLPLKRKSRKHIALTSGNGSREIMVIYSAGDALDLEELAAGESPRSDRVWEASKLFSASVREEYGQRLQHNGRDIRRAYMKDGLPIGLWLTRLICSVQVVFWVVLLISVAGLRSHSWYLVGVGSLGMLQNAVLAAIARKPDRRGLPLKLVDTIITRRVMDGLMDLESTIHGAGQPLVNEFFQGSLRESETLWWNGERDSYDNDRVASAGRGRPRSRLDRKKIDVPHIDHHEQNEKVWRDRRTYSWETSARPIGPELRSTSLSLDARGSEPGVMFLGKKQEGDVAIKHESPIPSRNDHDTNSSVDSVRSPDWA